MVTLLRDPSPAPEAAEARPAIERDHGRAVLTGNELILKGALEAGVSLVTGYPGSPVAEVLTACGQHAGLLRALGVEAVLADNEAQAAAMLNGARQVPGARSLAVMKSVGAYVALDGLAIANAAHPATGAAAVVVVGDDPALSSTQVGADSRLTLAAGRIPVVEPATTAGIIGAIRAAFTLSEESGLIVGVVVTTTQADGIAVAELRPNEPPAVGPARRGHIDTQAVEIATHVSLPPHAAALERDLLDRRFPALQAAAGRLGLDVREGPSHGAIGLVTAGAAATLVHDALHVLGLDGAVPLLTLGLTWPVREATVSDLGASVGEIVVIEERAGHLEDQVRRALADLGRAVHGKRLPLGIPGFPAAGGLTADLVRDRLSRLVLARPEGFPEVAVERAHALLAAAEREPGEGAAPPTRSPTYCAGCPHRGTSSAMVEVRRRLSDPEHMRRVHGRAPVDVIAHGGIGCYSMASMPPWLEMHDLSAMGLGGATGAGSAPLVDNRHYVLVGDGTFFHGEMATIANAVKQRQDILFVILDNKTTAMTGHQGTPGSATDLMGRPQSPVEIEAVVRAMGPGFLRRVDPDDRDAYIDLLERCLLMDGTRVLIADKECAITKGRRDRAERARSVAAAGFERSRSYINIAEDACENCRECTKATACPGLTIVDTPLGEKVAIDRETCVDDAYCTRVKACPSFERVTVRRRRAPRRAPLDSASAELPDPVPAPRSERFTAVVAGVGGMGVGVAARILIEAAAGDWPTVDAYQRKGLAQRGGSVFANIVMHDGTRARPVEPASGEIDLVIGLEPVEALRTLRRADPTAVAAVVDTAARPTTTMLTGQTPRLSAVEDAVHEAVAPEHAAVAAIGEACQRELGTRLVANVAAIGLAYQRGDLPLSRAALEAAIRRVSGARHSARNLAAFALGRSLAQTPGRPTPPPSLEALAEGEARAIRRRPDRNAYGALMAEARSTFDEAVCRLVAVRLPDLLAWGGSDYARQYLDTLADVAARRPVLVDAVAHNLHRVMAIKDEVFVAHLLTSPRKYARDRERFAVDASTGDRLSYVHFNRVSVRILGRRVEFDVRTRDWMLAAVRSARVARRLLPGWHREERTFRDWYRGTVLHAVLDGALDPDAALEAVRLPEQVTGFREIRIRKQHVARTRFAALIDDGGDS